jgi:hypothetical protein
MPILTVKSVALTSERTVSGNPEELTAAFDHQLRQAAIEIVRTLARQYARHDLEVEVY